MLDGPAFHLRGDAGEASYFGAAPPTGDRRWIREHANFIRQCTTKLGTDKSLLIRGDVFRFIKSCRQQFDFIFADPPYALPELEKIPDLIFQHQLLKPDGVFVFEHGKGNDFSQHPHFVEHRAYGSVNFSLFKAGKESE